MTIDKAIEILGGLRNSPSLSPRDDIYDAIVLGLQGLKAVKHSRMTLHPLLIKDLPGEDGFPWEKTVYGPKEVEG